MYMKNSEHILEDTRAEGAIAEESKERSSVLRPELEARGQERRERGGRDESE